MDKFKIFNKIKIDTDKYQEVETNNEELKTKMLIKINSSKRSMIKRKINSCFWIHITFPNDEPVPLATGSVRKISKKALCLHRCSFITNRLIINEKSGS